MNKRWKLKIMYEPTIQDESGVYIKISWEDAGLLYDKKGWRNENELPAHLREKLNTEIAKWNRIQQLKERKNDC